MYNDSINFSLSISTNTRDGILISSDIGSATFCINIPIGETVNVSVVDSVTLAVIKSQLITGVTGNYALFEMTTGFTNSNNTSNIIRVDLTASATCTNRGMKFSV